MPVGSVVEMLEQLAAEYELDGIHVANLEAGSLCGGVRYDEPLEASTTSETRRGIYHPYRPS
jgi:hypothetical protein